MSVSQNTAGISANGQRINNISNNLSLNTTNGSLAIGKNTGILTDTNKKNNTFIGDKSGQLTETIVSNNVYLGFESGSRSTDSINDSGLTENSSQNVFVGSKSGRTNTSGKNNVFLGYQSGLLNNTGYNNTFIGYRSGKQSQAGHENILIGVNTGTTTIGNNNILIGSNLNVLETDSDYNLNIGNIIIGKLQPNQKSITIDLDGYGKLEINGNFETKSLTATNISALSTIIGTISSIANHNTNSLSEGSNNLYYTNERSRLAISVIEDGGDGSLEYDNMSGEITYTGPSADEVRAHISGGTGVNFANGEISIGQSVETTDNVTFSNIDATGDTSLVDVVASGTLAVSGHTSLATGGGAVNIATTGAMTTVNGTLNVDEAVTLDTTLNVTGDTTIIAKFACNNNSPQAKQGAIANASQLIKSSNMSGSYAQSEVEQLRVAVKELQCQLNSALAVLRIFGFLNDN